MASKTIPEIDLALLSDYKSELLADLKHALLNFGFFYIKNYDDLLDQNVIDLLFEQSEKVLKLDQDEKMKHHRKKSKHFLGYDTELNSYDQISREEIDFCSTNKVLKEYSCIYYNYFGPNQYPSGVTLFKKSVDQFFQSLNTFSYRVIELIFESLLIDQDLSSIYIESKDKQILHSETKVSHQLPAQPKIKVPDQIFDAHKEYQFLKFLFHQNSLQVQDIYGAWIDIPQKPNTIVVGTGQLLEFLTKGFCIANNYKVISSKTESTGITFSPTLKLDSRLKPFELTGELLYERDQRDNLSTNYLKSKSDLKIGDIIGEKIFYNKIKHHKEVSELWYPEILQKLNQQEIFSKLNSQKQVTDIEQTIKRLSKVFFALDKSVPLVIRNRTSNAKLAEVIPKIKSFTGFNVSEKELLQVSFLYPDAVPLLLNDYNELIIDTDKAKDAFTYKTIAPRAEEFHSRVSTWLHKNKNRDDVPTLSRSNIEKPTEGPVKKRLKTEILQNSKEKYIFKQKSEKVEAQKTGLSLLERIKQKEREKMKNYESPELKYQHFLDGKLKSVLEILFTLRPDTSYTLNRLGELIKNSLTKSPVSEDEAKDIAIYLTKKFPDKFNSVDTKDSKVLKWGELDREELLSRLD